MARLTNINKLCPMPIEQHIEWYQTCIEKLKQYEDTGLEPEEINALAANDRTVTYDENGDPYLLRAEGAEAKHIVDLLAAEYENRLIVQPIETCL